jgi:hypothetical protein
VIGCVWICVWFLNASNRFIRSFWRTARSMYWSATWPWISMTLGIYSRTFIFVSLVCHFLAFCFSFDAVYFIVLSFCPFLFCRI